MRTLSLEISPLVHLWLALWETNHGFILSICRRANHVERNMTPWAYTSGKKWPKPFAAPNVPSFCFLLEKHLSRFAKKNMLGCPSNLKTEGVVVQPQKCSPTSKMRGCLSNLKNGGGACPTSKMGGGALALGARHSASLLALAELPAQPRQLLQRQLAGRRLPHWISTGKKTKFGALSAELQAK